VEAADETIHSTITFFRCTKCGTTRRESGWEKKCCLTWRAKILSMKTKPILEATKLLFLEYF
jgi:hypothetical protein